MAQLSKNIPENAVLAIFYDIDGDIIQIDPMVGGTLYDAAGKPVQIDPSAGKLTAMLNLCATKAQRLLRQEPTLATTVTRVSASPDCLWIDHGGRNVWRC